jgi:glutathione synthase/RimK-type ligase-like ATP-grasp enzyme
VDLATDAVVRALQGLDIPVVRVNTEDLPFSGVIDYSIGVANPASIFMDGGRAGEWFGAVWYRRLRVPTIPPEMDAGVYDFCVRENRSALIGGLIGHETRWMSHPGAIWKAEFKPYQLQMAAKIGLDIPKTLISNRAESIREFHQQYGPIIAKPVRSGHVVKGGVECAVFTTKLEDEVMNDLSDAALSPTIYQEFLPKAFDIRVTIVGRKLFAVSIDSQSDPSAVIDWRKTENPLLPHAPIELPGELQRSLLELMSRLSLTYGAIDLVLTPDGRYVFLEINPNGQWLWIDEMLSLGISHSIAEWLSEGTK